MKIEIVEYLLIGLILILQLGFFIYTYNKIRIYQNLIPDSDLFKITKIYVPASVLEIKSSKVILNDLDYYKNSHDDLPVQEAIGEDMEFDFKNNILGEIIEISIVECDKKSNIVFDNILNSLNTYLIRNRSSASDFNLIKDIIERNSNSIEEEINLTISAPLYLGLVGTMIGIVIGLFYMADYSNSFGTNAINSVVENANMVIQDNKENIDKDLIDSISILLGGVKIAMIASLFGLLLIIINSSVLFKIASKIIDNRKNDLYSFIQIELLPILNQGLGSTFESLQRNLLKFNSELSENLNGLSGIFDSNRDALFAQQEILSKIEKIPVAEIAKYNIKVMQELQNSTDNISQFNKYLNNINSFVANSDKLVKQSNDILSRTHNFETIAERIEDNLAQSQKLMEFLSNHYEKLEEYKRFVSNTVADVGISVTDTFKDLEEHIQKSTKAVKDFTIDELDALKNALSQSKTNLSNLEHLATITKDVAEFKGSSFMHGENVKQNLMELSNNIKKSTDFLEALESTTLTHRTKVMASSVKNLFGRKKP